MFDLSLTCSFGDYRNETHDVRYGLEDFLQLRSNNAAYTVFYRTFVSTVVGKMRFKKALEDKNKTEDIATISDEALALLALENAIERWDDEYDRSEGQIRPIRKGQTRPAAWISEVETKYTVAKSENVSGLKRGSDKRWSWDGITRFNQLHTLIKADRAEHPDFFATFKENECKDLPSTRTTSEDNNELNPVAINDLPSKKLIPKQEPTTLTAAKQTAGVDDESTDSEVVAKAGKPDDDSDDDGSQFGAGHQVNK